VNCEHGNPVRVSEPFTGDQCYRCWRRARVGLPVASGAPRRGQCLHLGPKIDGPRQAKCQCRHTCEAKVADYAVPAGNCQTCLKWEADS
jgi:hypothetical protein